MRKIFIIFLLAIITVATNVAAEDLGKNPLNLGLGDDIESVSRKIAYLNPVKTVCDGNIILSVFADKNSVIVYFNGNKVEKIKEFIGKTEFLQRFGIVSDISASIDALGEYFTPNPDARLESLSVEGEGELTGFVYSAQFSAFSAEKIDDGYELTITKRGERDLQLAKK